MTKLERENKNCDPMTNVIVMFLASTEKETVALITSQSLSIFQTQPLIFKISPGPELFAGLFLLILQGPKNKRKYKNLLEPSSCDFTTIIWRILEEMGFITYLSLVVWLAIFWLLILSSSYLRAAALLHDYIYRDDVSLSCGCAEWSLCAWSPPG